MNQFKAILEERNRLAAEVAKLNKVLDILSDTDIVLPGELAPSRSHKRKRGRPKGSRNKVKK
jgi:hypothetical protein